MKKETKTLKETIKEIHKKHGEDSLVTLEDKPHSGVDALPTGSMGLDHATGIGGLPRGRIIEIYGPASAGKTTLALTVVAQAQRRGWGCAYIDAEHALDPVYAQILGVDTSKLLLSQPDSGEEGLQIVEELVRSGHMGVIVVDSVASLTPRSIIEGEIGDIKVAALARLMSSSLGKLKGIVEKSDTIVIFINQLRSIISTFTFAGAPTETTSGGQALKFYSDVRIEVKAIGAIKKGEERVGTHTRIKVVKNKVGPPFRVTEVDILYNEGISHEAELLYLGEKYGVLSEYKWGEIKLGRGYDSARAELKKNPEMAKDIESQILEKMKE